MKKLYKVNQFTAQEWDAIEYDWNEHEDEIVVIEKADAYCMDITANGVRLVPILRKIEESMTAAGLAGDDGVYAGWFGEWANSLTSRTDRKYFIWNYSGKSDRERGCWSYSWGIEQIDDDRWYIFLNIAKPQDTTTETTEEEEEGKTMFTTYEEAVTADVREYITENYSAEEIAEAMTDREEFEQTLNDDLWVEDGVTGNGSGSYTFDRAQAREYVLTDIDTVREALIEFGTEADTIADKFLHEDWEYFDVTARCYVLGQAIVAALDALEAPTLAPSTAACVW